MEKRDLNNYYPKFYSYFDPILQKTIRVGEILSSFRSFDESAMLVFEGWKSEDAFDDREKPLQYFRVELRVDELPIGDALEAKAIAFLTDEDPANWRKSAVTVDMNNKKAFIQITHRTIADKTIAQAVNTEALFDEFVAAEPELAGMVQIFSWNYGKANNDLLAKFE